MSIPQLPDFDADGYQVEPSTEKVNEIITAINDGGGEIALLPTFAANGYQVEPSTDKLNEIITELNNGGGSLDLLPTFASDGYQVQPSVAKLNEVIVAVESYGAGGDVVIESLATSEEYAGYWNMPSGIQAGDLLLAVTIWGDQFAAPIDGFTILESAGVEYSNEVFQYKIATGSEGATIAADPSWADEAGVVLRISGVNTSDPINVAGVSERIQGSADTSKTLELDSISPDAAGCALVVIAVGSAGGASRTLTVEGVDIGSYGYDGTWAAGGNVEILEASGATGTRTVVLSTPTAASNNLLAAMVALNPA